MFLPGLAHVYLSNQRPLSLVLLVLSFLVPTVGQLRRCHCSLVLSFHEQPPSHICPLSEMFWGSCTISLNFMTSRSYVLIQSVDYLNQIVSIH